MANLYDEGVTNHNEGEQDYDHNEKDNDIIAHYKPSKNELFAFRALSIFIILAIIASFAYYQGSITVSPHFNTGRVISDIEDESIYELKEYSYDLSLLMDEITILNNTINTNMLNHQQNIIEKIKKSKHEKQSMLQDKYVKLQTFIKNITNALKSIDELIDNTDIDPQQRMHKIIWLRNTIFMQKLPINIDNFLTDLSFVLYANNELSFLLTIMNEEKSESMHKKITQMVDALNESFGSKNKLIEDKQYQFATKSKNIHSTVKQEYTPYLNGFFGYVLLTFLVAVSTKILNMIANEYLKDTNRSHLTQQNMLLHAEIDQLKQQQSVNDYGAQPQQQPIVHHKKKKSKKCRKFKYKHDFDKNGIIYYLGTKYCSSKKWINPVSMNIINIKTSNWILGTAQDIISRNNIIGQCYGHGENEFVEIHFNSNMKIKPNKYTLRHPNKSIYYLRSWTFSGSVDGINWDTLRMHHNDMMLNKRSKSHSWKVNTSKYYQMFKIQMTDKNAGDLFGRTWQLWLNGFEIYGDFLN